MLSSGLGRGALALLLSTIPSLCQAGLTPRLVRDIEETSYAGSSSPRQFGLLYRGVAFTASEGRELWIYDIHDGTYLRALQREEVRRLQGSFYAAREAKGGWRFWQAWGYPYDTAYPIDGRVGWLGAVYQSQLEWGNSPFLFEADRGTGRGLWALIGGLAEVARPLPLEDGRLLRDWTPELHKAWFIARHRTLGTALWKTDGTKAGTMAVTAPSPGQTVPLRLVGRLHRRLLLAISGGEPELWWSDGSPRGLRPFLEIVRGSRAATVSAARVVGGRAFLVVDDGRHGRQLWTSDGTAAGTLQITSFAPDPLRQIDIPVLRQAGRWYFVADDGVHGRELWQTDGTRQGTRLVIDLCPGPCSSDPQDLASRNNMFGTSPGLFFAASAAEGPRALWLTNGTPEETMRLTPPDVEATTGLQYDFFFAARTALLGDELWVTAGTPESTKLWADLQLEKEDGSHPFFIGAAGHRLFFQPHDPEVGYGLWTSDGTVAGTHEIPTPPDLLMDRDYTVSGVSFGESMLFVGETRDGTALWSIDSTGTTIVRLTPPGVGVYWLLANLGDRIVFFAQDVEHGLEIWTSEGTPESTHLVADLTPGPGSTGFNLNQAPLLLRGQFLFQRADDFTVPELWLTDGTAAGTRRLVDADPLLAPLDLSGQMSVAEAGGKLFFLGATELGGDTGIWVSDGTAAGTAPLAYADAAGSFEGFFPTANHLYFAVGDPEGGLATHLWRTDGTPAGTFQTPAQPDSPAISPPPVLFGDRLVFTGKDYGFWITDGTTEGTFPLLDPQGHGIPRADSHSIEFKDHLVFAIPGYDNDGVCYVWNGTGARAQRLENLSCGSFLAVRDRLYFSGFQPETGAELWVMEEQ